MSITVRSWSESDLKKIKTGKDKWLATVFMNGSSFGKKEIQHYPYQLRKTYIATLDCDGENEEEIKFYATDTKNAKRFVKAEYKCPISSLVIVETKYKKVK
jgi:hypothetical protein